MHVMAIFEKLFLKNKKSLSVDNLKLAKIKFYIEFITAILKRDY